eukprot:Hpha_TRINITY_DN3358_c0_g1::TRINITY_DN3358_c0_g1_i1::g.172236::m.172236
MVWALVVVMVAASRVGGRRGEELQRSSCICTGFSCSCPTGFTCGGGLCFHCSELDCNTFSSECTCALATGEGSACGTDGVCRVLPPAALDIVGHGGCLSIQCDKGASVWDPVGKVCRCECLNGYAGVQCDQCAAGFSGFPICASSAVDVPENCLARVGINTYGHAFRTFNSTDAAECCAECGNTDGICKAWTFSRPRGECWLKFAAGGVYRDDAAISGTPPASTSVEWWRWLLLALAGVFLAAALAVLVWLIVGSCRKRKEKKKEVVFEKDPASLPRESVFGRPAPVPAAVQQQPPQPLQPPLQPVHHTPAVTENQDVVCEAVTDSEPVLCVRVPDSEMNTFDDTSAVYHQGSGPYQGHASSSAVHWHDHSRTTADARPERAHVL